MFNSFFIAVSIFCLSIVFLGVMAFSILDLLDKDIDEAISSKVKMFDESKDLTSKHIMMDYTDDSLERYRRKLNKI